MHFGRKPNVTVVSLTKILDFNVSSFYGKYFLTKSHMTHISNDVFTWRARVHRYAHAQLNVK